MVGTLVIQPPKGMSLEEAKTALKMLKFKILLEDTSETLLKCQKKHILP